MSTGSFLLTVGLIALATMGYIVVVVLLYRRGQKPKTKGDLLAEAREDVDHIFNDDFREELRNRGRLHFEKIIRENAMFLQQDLRLTTAQLNDFMKEEIKRVLKEEFAKYEESITTARDQAIETIQKTQAVIEQERQELDVQLHEEAAAEKAQLIDKFEKNMGEVVNHYLIEAIGSEIDLTDQLDYIFDRLEENKQAMLEDIRGGT